MIILIQFPVDVNRVVLLRVEIDGVLLHVFNQLSDVLRCSATRHEGDECADDHPLGELLKCRSFHNWK